jgi:hypothetical protein
MGKLTVNLVIAVTITSLFAIALSAQAGDRVAAAAQAQLETAYPVAADPYLPFQMIEPAY